MIRILLVEDDPVIRDTTSYFLNCQQNFEVVCADTGGEALSHAREKFDVILMDIRMPEMRGDEFLEWIKSNQLFKHIPVVMLSSEDSTTERIRLLQEGAEDYIVKPFNPMELKVRIKKIIE